MPFELLSFCMRFIVKCTAYWITEQKVIIFCIKVNFSLTTMFPLDFFWSLYSCVHRKTSILWKQCPSWELSKQSHCLENMWTNSYTLIPTWVIPEYSMYDNREIFLKAKMKPRYLFCSLKQGTYSAGSFLPEGGAPKKFRPSNLFVYKKNLFLLLPATPPLVWCPFLGRNPQNPVKRNPHSPKTANICTRNSRIVLSQE